MKTTLKRASVTLAVIAASVSVPLAAASPASAAYTACLQYISDSGYQVGPKVRSACNHKATRVGPLWVANLNCVNKLVAARVTALEATNACIRAH
ncbi:hypothetical protein [Streptomyces sp. t39]|uniref:hypothetical protein n=1 Tax=Streptomyces sp. t39 TaxID=1828156 RepID=UPI0011CEBF00|nr:hypothetical protein [Streptomyces sp. t39]